MSTSSPRNLTWMDADAARDAISKARARLEQWYGALILDGDLAEAHDGETAWVLDEPAAQIRAFLDEATGYMTRIMVVYKDAPQEDPGHRDELIRLARERRP